jgi:DNA mismatch repair protein MutS2
MLTELATSRMALDEEQRAATRIRAETEAARDEYREKLQRLQERRDKLFHSMREDLDVAFKSAHEEVASVIRELQRGGSAQQAAQARKQLLSLEEETRQVETKLEVKTPSPEAAPDPIDWRKAQPGDPVLLPGGARGVLESLPDRRGRVRVRAGNAAMVLGQDRLAPAAAMPVARAQQKVQLQRAQAPQQEAPGGGSQRCDLRGLRVDEAIDKVAETLDLAVVEGRDAAVFIHGFGTGALRSAVREYLQRSPYVERYVAGDEESDTDGVTTAELAARRN